ncbi:MAG: selenocysteine-specific elongation factor, partial [Actinomycetota bacterium]|nr:selenocysteine-specific elongation factor [Actinomycetota bacterium]
AAGESWMPQTEEHLRILELLDIRHGLVVVTKADAVSSELVDLTVLEVEEHLEGSTLGHAPLVVCDSISGRGLDDVRKALDEVLASAPAPDDRGRPRLWIDRVFAPRGVGTVVTGTLAGGGVAVDEHLEIPRLSRTVRVRGIETAHRQVEQVGPGARVALNLAGVEHHALGRGDALVRRGQWQSAGVVDVEVTLLPGAPAPLPARLVAAVGSGEHPIRLRHLGGDGHYARLRFARPLPLAAGDRMVLRDPARARTVAGAVVLDVDSTCNTSEAAAALSSPLGARLLAGHGWLRRPDLERLADLDSARAATLADDMVESGAARAAGDWLVAPPTLSALNAATRAAVVDHHEHSPHSAGLELGVLATSLRVEIEQLLAALPEADGLVVEQGVVRDESRRARASESDAARTLVAELDATPFAPPAPTDVSLARALVREGTLVDVDGILFTAAAVDRARALIVAALATRDAISIGDAREILVGSSRKYVVPLLSRFDAEGVTRRRGDTRVRGPRADQL